MLPAATAVRLEEHARHLLDGHGCREEPLTWSPPVDRIRLGDPPEKIPSGSTRAGSTTPSPRSRRHEMPPPRPGAPSSSSATRLAGIPARPEPAARPTDPPGPVANYLAAVGIFD